MPAVVTVATVAEPVASRISTATNQASSSGDTVLPATQDATTLETPLSTSTCFSPPPAATISRMPAIGGSDSSTVVLMLAKAIADVIDENGHGATKRTVDFIGTPLIALLLAVLLAMFTLGVRAGFDKQRLATTVDESLPPIAGILLIVAAGGGLKQVLVDSGVSKVVASWVAGSTVSPLLLAWFVAVLIRLATGSATVATVTTAGILQPVAETLSTSHLSLLVLAIGAGSLFFSHVNDAGFWLTKQYFGLSVSQNIKTWSVMETILSVTGILMVLALSVVI
jgi:GntP family gluconate:H+ symporter